jgi:adenine-specific DNA-methyltransferase
LINSQQPTANSQQPTANSQQLALLKKHFANCFDKHGNFIAAKLQEIVQDSGVALSKEGYSLNWLGKSYARLLANENIRTRLVADSAHNENPANAASQNLLIKGDNLEVLKHLMGAYSEQVKMIYIDPPYNTGSDGFVYQDDRKFSVEQLSSLAGIDEDEARRILTFTSSSSNSHSAWLTFMYPRLYLAKQLLRDDGVIFISIDDNEQAQLKALCDEALGEENFVATFVWETKQAARGVPPTSLLMENHEYIICYGKQANNVRFRGLDRKESDFANPDNDPRGLWRSESMKATGKQDSHFKIVEPKTGREFQGNWAFAEKTIQSMIDAGLILFPSSSDGVPRQKKFINSYLNETKAAVTSLRWHSTEASTKDSMALFDGKKIFDFPKPLSLLDYLCRQASVENDIVLDFFAGSGTTAHAVMQLNAEDGGNRQFICVQIDEATDPKSEAYKAGYKTIFDITQARISKAAVKIKADLETSVIPAQAGIQPNKNPVRSADKTNSLFETALDSRLRGNDEIEGGAGTTERELDLGFKVFATQPMFDKYLDTPESLTENLELFDVKTLSQPDRHSLMLTWALRDGIKLGAPLSPVSLGGYTAYAAEKILYFVEPDISLTAVVALLEQLDNNPVFAPSRLVVLGYLLDSKTQREMSEAVKGYNNRKGIELTLDIRYN